MEWHNHPAVIAARRDVRIARIEAAKAEIREYCQHKEGCEADCFACPRTYEAKPVDESKIPQRTFKNRCINCQQNVLTTTGVDPLTCWKCRDLPDSADLNGQKWWS